MAIRKEVALQTRAESLIDSALFSIQSVCTKRAYHSALRQWIAKNYTLEPYFVREHLAGIKHASTANQALSAIKLLARTCAEYGWLNQEAALRIQAMKGRPLKAHRTGRWLTLEEATALLNSPPLTAKGLRDRALLALLIGAGLRRTELAQLKANQLQKRESRWVLLDVLGKGGRLRTIGIPNWVAERIANVTTPPEREARSDEALLHAINGTTLSASGIWRIVKSYSPDLAPHDLRRTFAKLARNGGAKLEQIQAALGHASVVTTERYLGPDLGSTAGDKLGIEL